MSAMQDVKQSEMDCTSDQTLVMLNEGPLRKVRAFLVGKYMMYSMYR